MSLCFAFFLNLHVYNIQKKKEWNNEERHPSFSDIIAQADKSIVPMLFVGGEKSFKTGNAATHDETEFRTMFPLFAELNIPTGGNGREGKYCAEFDSPVEIDRVFPLKDCT